VGLLTVMASPITLLESATKRGAIVTCLRRQGESAQEVKRQSGPIPRWRWRTSGGEAFPRESCRTGRGSTSGGDPSFYLQWKSILDRAIGLLLNQTYGNWSLIIRDDGSTDDTVEIIRDYRERFPGKVTLLEGQGRRLGPCQSYARLLERTTANYIMFCDQDDLWLPEKIEETLHRMRSLELQYPGLPLLIHTDMKVADRDLRVSSDSFWPIST